MMCVRIFIFQGIMQETAALEDRGFIFENKSMAAAGS
jgi:hypothetical protein